MLFGTFSEIRSIILYTRFIDALKGEAERAVYNN